MSELPKTFDPAAIEARWYAHWEERGLFHPDRPGAEPWTIVNPPPNVTGSLHVGHALDNTLQDILTRHARLKGKDALWVVGTDHAGIATQMVVERNLAKDGVKRTDLTREAFVERVWDWKAESGGEITRQLRRLGCSMDWANERFTMDEGFSKAVRHVFVELYRQGLLYRDKRLVNWDPFFRTAISDLEVEQRELAGSFWHFRYPMEDGSGYVAIATTRPETILGDGAVAVHPDDDRYRHLVGKRCRLPLVDRLIPIIADEHVRMDFGSGAVKITAAHDHNDYEMYKRHPDAGIPLINLMNADATMNDNCPPAYRGLDRYAARAKVVEEFDALGLLDKIEPITHSVPFGDRSGVVIEPWLTDQWYVDAATLAKPAVEAVRSGKIRIVPKTWEKTFFSWMENIQPWCVSRQLWWGHRIPAWFGFSKEWLDRNADEPFLHIAKEVFNSSAVDQTIFVAETETDALEQAERYYGPEYHVYVEREAGEVPLLDESTRPAVCIVRDDDVLDTWFSSALWPFATLGWPEATDPKLGGRYPNDVLISGFDILFFWDARMMMQGLHFLGDVPFKTLYLHGLVRAADGQKMSKSKGNTVDPLGLIDRYGADALRFFMAAMESQGRDIKMDERRVEGYRNFATKLWNAARFCQANGIGASRTLEPPVATSAVNKWIIAETVRTIQSVDLSLADYRFDAAANALYQFVWSRFCDWYLELIKPVFTPTINVVGPGEGKADSWPELQETRAVAGWVLDQILVLLHPFMPFITEELWHAMGARDHELIVASWPMADARALDPLAEAEVDWLIRLVSEVRAARTELNVPPGAKTDVMVLTTPHAGYSGNSPPPVPNELIAKIDKHRLALARLARMNNAIFVNTGVEIELATGTKLDRTRLQDSSETMGPQIVVDDVTYILPVEDVIDLDAERARLTKGIAAAEKERDSLASRLANASFVERAKAEAIDKARADHADKSAEADRLRAALGRLG